MFAGQAPLPLATAGSSLFGGVPPVPPAPPAPALWERELAQQAQAALERELLESRAEAAWVGWGFVSEHARFAELCRKLPPPILPPPRAATSGTTSSSATRRSRLDTGQEGGAEPPGQRRAPQP